jgi:hypothetical protein
MNALFILAACENERIPRIIAVMLKVARTRFAVGGYIAVACFAWHQLRIFEG